MTISEFIKELEKIKAEYGDLDVGMVSAYTCNVNFELVVCKSVCYKNMPGNGKIEPDTELEETPYCEIYAEYIGEDY